MNLSAARQLNDSDYCADACIRVTKFLFPHGCLLWRECPNCGQLSTYYGDEWKIDSSTLLPPPPLRAFSDGIEYKSWISDREDDVEQEAWRLGKVDARACVHCENLNYSDHAPLLMQSSLKSTPLPPYIEEAQRDMRVVVQNASHIVLMGYSLPEDDFIYRTILAARTGENSKATVKCSVVGVDSVMNEKWLGPGDFQKMLGKVPDAVKRAREIFGNDNVRYFGGGIPRVFLNEGSVVAHDAIERLLNWN